MSALRPRFAPAAAAEKAARTAAIEARAQAHAEATMARIAAATRRDLWLMIGLLLALIVPPLAVLSLVLAPAGQAGVALAALASVSGFVLVATAGVSRVLTGQALPSATDPDAIRGT